MAFGSALPYNGANVSRAPRSGGVYRLSYMAVNKKLVVFYVGQSEDLRDRLGDHLLPSEDNPCIRRHVRSSSCYFDWAIVESKPARDRLEREQIAAHRPECNRQ